jgi:hypothetical protein
MNGFHGYTRRQVVRALGVGGLALATGLRQARASESDPLPPIVTDWFAAWSSNDPAGELARLYAVDGNFEDIAAGVNVDGPEIAPYLRQMTAGLSDVNRHMRGTFAVGGMAAVEQLYVATNQGFLSGVATGAVFELYAVTLFEYDELQLYRTADYYDTGSILLDLKSG